MERNNRELELCYFSSTVLAKDPAAVNSQVLNISDGKDFKTVIWVSSVDDNV